MSRSRSCWRFGERDGLHGTTAFGAGGLTRALVIAKGTLDRVRRDFERFVLQHRLDPLVTRLGRERIEAAQNR